MTSKPESKQAPTPGKKGWSVADLEKTMGRKADAISDYVYDPETGGFMRNITFKLNPKSKSRGEG